MSEQFNISVQTEIWRTGGSMFADFGTMRWFDVDQEVVTWLAGSCKTTAFWLIGLPECRDGESFELKYRTIVTDVYGKPVSDTTLLSFENLSYGDVVRFEDWEMDQLRELRVLFSVKHIDEEPQLRKRSKTKAVWKLLRQFVRNKANE